MKVWDPLRKKEVAATPEEKVRQWFISQLLQAFGVPAHMMMSEVSMTFGSKLYRADIIIYGRDAAPLAAVECKKPDIALDKAVLEQVLRYNNVLEVKYLMVTNGLCTKVFRLEGGRFEGMDHMPPYEEMLCQR